MNILELTSNTFLKEKINTKFLKALTLVILFVLIFGTTQSYVYYSSLMPFGVGIVFSLLYINFSGYYLSPLYILSYVLAGRSIESFVISCNVALILCLLEFIKTKKNIQLKKLYITLSFLLSQVFYVIFSIGDFKNNLALIVSIVIGMLFLFASLNFLDATINKGLLEKINIDEKIYGGILLLVFSFGISGVNISIISIGLMIAFVIILTCSYIFSCGLTLIVGSIIGVGFSLYFYNPTYISVFITTSIIISAFKSKFRILSVIACVLSYVVFSLFFNIGISLGEVASVILSGIVFIVVPKKVLNSIQTIFKHSRKVAIQNIFNSSRSHLVSRVEDLSRVFAQMDKVYRDMVKGNLSDDDAKKMLKEELVSGVCSKCQNYNLCFREVGNFMDNIFDTVVSLGYEKGKVLLIDLPEYLTCNCNKINSIIQYINNLLKSYLEYRTSINNIDTSRMLIADQLSGVSSLLEALSKEVNINVNFNNNFEKTIKENLSYAGISCLECVVYEQNTENKLINLIVKNSNIKDKKIEKIISKTLNCKFRIDSIENSEIMGTISINLKTVPKYDIAFGHATMKKNGKIISGDSYSILDIGDGKFIVSICDGMGSGNDANNLSKLAINLIENFYRAGFENEIILNSINKLLSLTEQEKFSTIDLCMIDGKRGFYDFVKLAATEGYIKRQNGQIEVISSSGLPIGVLENIKPHITRKHISPMDMLIMTSDGVTDVLGDGFIDILRNLDSINPQILADEIMSIVLEKNGGVALDDITIICVRIFESV